MYIYFHTYTFVFCYINFVGVQNRDYKVTFYDHAGNKSKYRATIIDVVKLNTFGDACYLFSCSILVERAIIETGT